MATGIVSVGAHLLDVDAVAVALFAFNIAAYVVLWALTIVRIARHRPALLRDLTDHRVAFGFFTIVAGTCVLGTETILIADHFAIATVLLAIAAVINGGWLLSVVATQAIAVLTALLAAHWGQPLRMHANFVALSMWLWGGMLYIWIVALIFYRYMFFRFSPSDLAPPYWINMGAMAISTLAGALLITASPDAPFLASMQPFLEGFMVFYWATGTWWIPMIAILAIWRYGFRRQPFTYDPLYWGAVFPLGMYAVGTFEMERAMELRLPRPDPARLLRDRAGCLAGDGARPRPRHSSQRRAAVRLTVARLTVDSPYVEEYDPAAPDGAMLRRRASQGR